MQKSSTRYTQYDKDLILAAIKVGAQNGTHQDDIATMIAPLLQRKASAIVSQMYLIRADWAKQIDAERLLVTSKPRNTHHEVRNIDYPEHNIREYTPEPVTEPEQTVRGYAPKPVAEPEVVIIQKKEPKQDTPAEYRQHPPKKEPAVGDIVAVTVLKLTDFGAFVKANDSDITGLIHISNITDNFVYEIEDWLYVNQNINAEIIKIENGRYWFSTRDVTDSNVWRFDNQEQKQVSLLTINQKGAQLI